MNTKSKVTIRSLLSFIRIFEWGVHFLGFILIACCCYLTVDIPFSYYFHHVIILSIYFIFFASYGYLLNDYYDREIDQRQNKKKYFVNLSRFSFMLILLTLLICSFLIILFYYPKIEFILLYILQILFVTLYSIQPIRLKERGIYGILTAAIIQRVPHFIILAIVVSLNLYVTIYMSIWLTSLGILFIIEHQYEDFEQDKICKVKTFLVTIGQEKALFMRKLSYILFYSIVGILLLFYIFTSPTTTFNLSFVSTLTVISIISVVLLKIRYQLK